MGAPTQLQKLQFDAFGVDLRAGEIHKHGMQAEQTPGICHGVS